MLSVTTDLSEVINQVNRLLMRDLTTDRFVTAFVGILDPARHRLTYVSAGQGPLLVLCEQDCESRSATGLPLAVLEQATYEAQTLELAPGNLLAVLTDGFYETTNPQDQQFGEPRVVELLRGQAHRPLPQLIDALHAAICNFAGPTPQADDLTAVLLRRTRQ